jgi:hypothetical protein
MNRLLLAERIVIKMFTNRSVKNVYIKYYKLLLEQLEGSSFTEKRKRKVQEDSLL